MKPTPLNQTKKTIGLTLFISLVLFALTIGNRQVNAQTPNDNGVIYVTASGAGNKSGDSWANATNDLQMAINATGVQQLWVAKGTYKPKYRADNMSDANAQDRDNAFVLKKDVKIYGGFAGTETLLTDRNLKLSANASILSGDFNGDDAGFTNNGENAYHVVISAGAVGTAELNGFTITNGNANGNGYIMVNTKAIFRSSGGGIYNHESSPVLTHVIISANTTTTGGGGISNNASYPVLTNVSINGNTATNAGGGIYNYESSLVLTNVTISANTANFGGGISNSDANSKPQIRNSIIYGNNTGIEGAGTPVISYSLVQGLTDITNGNINGSTNPEFVDAANGDYSLKNTSPVINKGNNTCFSVGQTPDLSTITTDLDGSPRIQKNVVDMGAYESEFYPLPKPDANGIIYVSATGNGNYDGASWANATPVLQAAIDATGVQQVWVAAGEYQPTSGQSFSMKEGVKIYGGFAGTETILSQRNYKTNVASLKGNNNSVIRNDNNGLTAAAVLDGFTITNGYADNNGGGVYNYNSSPILSNLIIAGNSATNGGGIFNVSSSPVLTNVTISGNLASSTGGGVYSEVNCSLTLTNVTISGNSANFSSGIFNYQSNYIIRNSIVYRNNYVDESSVIYANSRGIGGAGGTVDIKYCLVQGVTTADANGNIDGATNPNFLNPLAPGLNSGGDYRLQNSSPAIGAGNNTFYAVGQTPDLSAITTDLAGNARIQKGKIDLGAYESEFDIALVPDASGVIYVTTAGAGNKSGNSWTNASDDLQMAINAANVQQVWVAGGTYKPKYRADNMSAANANDRNNAFVLKNNVQVYGGFAGTETLLGDRDLNNTVNATTLSGDFNGDDAGFTNNGENAYHVVVSSGNNNSAMLNGFTLSGANASSSANILINGNQVYQCSGGGIYLSASSPVLQNLIITRNTVSESGGGIFGYESSPLLSGITMQGNQAKDGGGMANQSQSSPVLSNIIITDNGASELGGGLYNVTSSSPILTNVSIGANTANSGGGIYNAEASSNPQIRNSIIYGNNTGIEGSGTPVVSYSLVQGSTDITNGNIDGNTNPDFVDAINGDYSLKNTSPLINKGSNTFYAVGQTPNLSAITTDLAGNPRIQKANIDMGAYESPYNTPLMPDADNIIYVSTTGNGNFKGDSWANAVPNLADALLWAQQTQISRTSTNPLKIYIAKGTYKPLYNAADGQNTADGGRDNAFVLSKNVKVYGGFDPANNISTLVNQRIFGENGTILSGDIGIQNDNSDNVYHVVISAGDLGATLLDGVVIEEGRAENPGGVKIVVNGENIYRNAGAGFYNNGASNVLKNVLIRNNYSEGHGSGVYNDGASINQQATHLLVSNSIISNNSGTGEGSFTCSGATATYLNTNFISNSGAAAQDSYNSTTNIYNSIWYNNGFTTPSCTNSTKVGMVKNSIVVNLVGINQELQHILQEPTNLMFESSQISYNDLFVLTSASPGVNKGSNTAYTTNGGDLINDKDLANNSRVYNGDIIDIGAYEYQGDPITLPVTLVSYDAKKNNNTTVLQWQSASEQNNKGFVIYRSSDGKVFVKLGDIRANDLFLYTYTDYSPLNGNNYYKLVQVDNDGKETDLGIRSLNFSLSAFSPQLYPNPTKDKIYLNTDANDTYTLLNSVGQKLRTGNATALRNGLDVSELPAGLYLITIAQKTYKFLKR